MPGQPREGRDPPMVETSLRDAVDGAEYVKFHESGLVFVAWHGGTTYNVYTIPPGEQDSPVHEVDVFSVSDEKGRPLDREAAKDRVHEHLGRIDLQN